MTQLFHSITAFFDKITQLGSFIFDQITEAFEVANEYVQVLPESLIVIFSIVIVLLIIFRLLGRDA